MNSAWKVFAIRWHLFSRPY